MPLRNSKVHRKNLSSTSGEGSLKKVSTDGLGTTLVVQCLTNTVFHVERKQAYQAAEEQKKLKRPAGAAAAADAATARPAKAARGAGLKSSNPSANAVVPEEYLPPNKTLFVQNLPEDYDTDGLTAIFGRFEGFREVRLVPGRKGIAFVEYEAEAGAISAKENTSGMGLGLESKPIKVVYQRQ